MAPHHRGALGARLDTLAIVRYFGGADELSYALKKHRIAEISPFAVKQWCTRRHIPFPRRLDLIALAERQKRGDFSLDKFKSKAEA